MVSMVWPAGLALVAGLVIATVTTPVGVSGAVFLLPVQLSMLHVPSPAVTPTNLLYNVVAIPGGLLRYHRQGQLLTPLAGLLVAGAVPGVVAGAAVRVYLAASPVVFRYLVGTVLLGLGTWLGQRTLRRTVAAGPPLRPDTLRWLATAAGLIGGIYGIGGGSILGPVLVGRGTPVAVAAPAALATTFVTSVVGAVTYTLLSLTAPGTVAPYWFLGIAGGLGGLAGGYLGARLQPHLPETALRLLLSTLAVALGTWYLVQPNR